ncbi:fasciclin-1 isoform X3 [Aphidius gifuensis]|uniref:fasciclin-1 isoform X3 n=1 Tax=Aphidius gifuensis TaxID=684658 RepID=UPI001CDCF411|nr:fasciclin-1 isoform X3 [Aphidius gifuensis]
MCLKMSCVAIVIFLGLHVVPNIQAVTVDVKMRDDSDLSEFYHLLEASQVANSTLMYRHVTVFAPTNRAFQETDSNDEHGDLVLYHMSNLPKTLDEMGDSISSELDGNPPLWVTRKRAYPHDEIYINNAKILEGSNFKSTIKLPSGDVKTQVLHKISDVLEPIQSISRESPIYNPNAFQFLNQSDSLKLGKHRIRTFRQCVLNNNKEDIFKQDGGYTFFIPDEEGFKSPFRPNKVDRQVIDGHVVPNHVLFTAPTPNDRPYETLANTDNFKVTISFLIDPNSKRMYVKSNTLIGDAAHPTGVVLSEIVKANIPVKNGVVHLIQRPLMVVDTTVQQFLMEKEDGPVYKFYQAIADYGDNFMDTITRLQDITLFAPSNAAWEEEGVKHILQDRKRFKEILNLHYVKEKLPLDKIRQKSVNQMVSTGKVSQYGVPTAAAWKNLYFNVIEGSNGSQTVTVEGGGVNATVITANIAATNGIIHIIDRVLGIPYTTVLDKMRTDPMLNSTYTLGMRSDFNKMLNKPNQRYTFFVPRDSAWDNTRMNMASTYKKIFMPQFSYHTKQILERHVAVGEKGFSMADLKRLSSSEPTTLRTLRDSLKIRVREHDGSYQIEWQNRWIRVFRPDVACTNGIIHVIDDAFLTESDVTVTADVDDAASSIASFTPHFVMILIAKWLL